MDKKRFSVVADIKGNYVGFYKSGSLSDQLFSQRDIGCTCDNPVPFYNNQEQNACFDPYRKLPFRGFGALKLGIYIGFVLRPKRWCLVLNQVGSSDTVWALQSILPFQRTIWYRVCYGRFVPIALTDCRYGFLFRLRH